MSHSSKLWTAIQQLFEQALDQPVENRQQFLKDSTASNEVIKEVSDMLLSHTAEPLFLENTAEQMTGEEITPERLGPYLIDKELGKGGMSVVYLATRDDNTFNRKVAIKTLHHIINTPAIRERFRHEQCIHARLDHPHIARLLDAGVTQAGKPFLVMQYVDGQPIIDYANAHQYCIDKRLALIVQVCHAISFAHSHLILHRDIKPSNIMVDHNGQVVLLDFGIAKLLNENNNGEQPQLTREGEKLMTLSYASPEQILGDPLTTASDIYSLGVVFYQLLSGHRPFYGSGDYALSDAILNQQPPNIEATESGQKIPRDLQAIALKALEKRPQDRYGSVAEFLQDLQKYTNHEVISVRPPNLWQRLIKFYRRNPVTFPLASIALLGIMMSLSIALWQKQQAQKLSLIANNERDRAEQVVELLLDLFDSDPYADIKSRQDNITLRDFLISRAEKMQGQLSSQPQLQANLFSLFANLHSNLDQLELAESMAVKALALQRKIHGNMDLNVAKSANILGTLRQNQAHYDEAEVLFREALAIRTKLLPKNHPQLANSLNNLSTLLYQSGQKEQESNALDAQALAIREIAFGKESLAVAESLNNIAVSKMQSEDREELLETEAKFRRALAIRLEKLGNAHASTGNTMSNLANFLHDRGQLEEAEALFLDALKITEAALGPNHSRVSVPLFGLGQLYQDQSRWDEAHQIFTRSLAINHAALPAGHPYILDDFMELIDVNLSRKNLNAARNFLRAAQDIKTENENNIARLKQQQQTLEALEK